MLLKLDSFKTGTISLRYMTSGGGSGKWRVYICKIEQILTVTWESGMHDARVRGYWAIRP